MLKKYLYLGQHFLDEQDYQQAAYFFTKAIELDASCTPAYNNRGLALAETGKHEAAIEDFSHAIELDNKAFGAYNNRALSYYRLGELEKAIPDYDKAIELNPDISLFYSNRALTYYHQGKPFQALGDFDKALELDAENAEARDELKKTYEGLTDAEKLVAREFVVNNHSVDDSNINQIS